MELEKVNLHNCAQWGPTLPVPALHFNSWVLLCLSVSFSLSYLLSLSLSPSPSNRNSFLRSIYYEWTALNIDTHEKFHRYWRTELVLLKFTYLYPLYLQYVRKSRHYMKLHFETNDWYKSRQYLDRILESNSQQYTLQINRKTKRRGHIWKMRNE